MANITEIIEQELNAFNQSIKEDMRAKGMDTTKNASNSLRIEKRGQVYVSVGIDYIQYLDRGRPPGKFPPMDTIKRWVELKGLQVDPFVIARGIAENGTRIFRSK